MFIIGNSFSNSNEFFVNFPRAFGLDSSCSISSSYCRKNQLKLKKSTCPLPFKASKPTTLKYAYNLFDKSSRPVDFSWTEIDYDEYKKGNKKGITESDYFRRNETLLNEYNADGSVNNMYPVTCYSSGSSLNRRSLISALSFCRDQGCLKPGKEYHALIIKNGFDRDPFVNTSLIDMYATCEDINTAVKIFNQMPSLDVASCNCLILGYTKNGLFDKAFNFFIKFDQMGINPNHYTYSIMISVCSSLLAIREGQQLHAQIMKLQYLSKTAVGNSLLTMYCKCGMMEDAEPLFDGLKHRNVVSWTVIITGFKQTRDYEKALRLVCLMREEDGVQLNEYTFTMVFASCAGMKNLVSGQMFHAEVYKRGMAMNDFVGTAIVDMYSKLGELGDSINQLNEMGKSANKVSWNAQISGFVQNEKAEESLEAFSQMVRNNAECDEFTYSIVLKACSLFPSLATCQQIHTRVIKAKFEENLLVGSSLIEAYTKCGSMEEAERVFNHIISESDVVTWNSMIKAYSQNGYPKKALSLFLKMIAEGIKPTNSSFVAILSACSHSGLVQEGQKLYKSMMEDYDMQPEETHYSCMVDLLGRAGKVENALSFITNLPIKPTASIWRPLLAACRSHRNLQMAEFVAKKILNLDPHDATVYVTLSNMYAEAGRTSDAKKQRREMRIKKIMKEPGCSWIEVNRRINRFFSCNKSHPEMAKVYKKLKQVMQEIGNNGVGHKEDMTLYHSEKLAVCFGLISLKSRKPIRVFKNLRVCTDCHSFMKKLSFISDKEIVLRDNYRFHIFKQGFCSCGDYW